MIDLEFTEPVNKCVRFGIADETNSCNGEWIKLRKCFRVKEFCKIDVWNRLATKRIFCEVINIQNCQAANISTRTENVYGK